MKKHFFLKLNPPRATFAQDMSAEERHIMQQHVIYWTDLMNRGLVVAFGPVIDPAGVYGVGIVQADDPHQVSELIAHDPANGLNHYEFHPMLAVIPNT